MKWTLSLLILLTISAQADACGRCGLFGRRCRFVAVNQVKAVAVQAVPQTIVFNNSYPIAAPGLTAYTAGVPSYQTAAVGYQPTAALFAELAREALALSAQNAQLGAAQANVETGLQALREQRDLLNRRAAQMNARGPVSFTIHPDGRVTRSEATTDQCAAGSTPPPPGAVPYDNADVPPPPAPMHAASAPTITAKCAKCHSGDKPKGDFVLDGTRAIDDRTFRKAVEMIATNKMPPESEKALTPEDKSALLGEFLSLTRKE